MGTSFSIDFPSMKAAVEQLVNLGGSVANETVNLYSKLGELKTVWTGESHDQFAEVLNSDIEFFKEIQKAVSQDIPGVIIDIVNAYKKLDANAAAVSQSTGTIKDLTRLDTNTASTQEFKFNQDSVENIKRDVDEIFTEMKKNVSEMLPVVKDTKWEGEAKNAWVKRIETVLNSLNEKQQEYLSLFAEYVQQTIDNMTKGEGYIGSSANGGNVTM